MPSHCIPTAGRVGALAGCCLLALPLSAQLNPQTVVTLRPVNLVAVEPDQPAGRGTPAEFWVDAWPPPATSLTVGLHLGASSIPAAGPAKAGQDGGAPGLLNLGTTTRWVLEGLNNVGQPGASTLYGYLPPGSTGFPVRVWLPYDETPQPDRQLVFTLRSFGSYTVGEPSHLTLTLHETPPLNRQPQARWIAVPGAAAPGEALTFTGEAWDPDGVVTRLDFYHATNHVGWLLMPAHAPGSTKDFTWRWDAPPIGTGSLTVIPTDERGRSGVPAHAEFRVPPRFVVEADPPGVLAAPATVTVRLRTEPGMDGFANVSFTVQGETQRVSSPPFAATFTLTHAGVHEVITEGLWRNQRFTAPRLRLEVAGPDAPPLVELEPVSTVVREGGADELVLVFRRRGGDLAAPLAVPLLLGRPAEELPPPRRPTPPALGPADLQKPLPGEIVFPPGHMEVVWRSAVVNDAEAVGSRGLLVVLQPPAGVNRGIADSARLLVLDDDVPEVSPVELILNGDPEEVFPTQSLRITARFQDGGVIREGLLRLDGRRLPGRDTWTLAPESLLPGPHRAEVELVDAWMRRGRAGMEFQMRPRVMQNPALSSLADGRLGNQIAVLPVYPWDYQLELSDDLVHWRPAGDEVIPQHRCVYLLPFDPRVKTHGFVRAVSEVAGPGAPPR